MDIAHVGEVVSNGGANCCRRTRLVEQIGVQFHGTEGVKALALAVRCALGVALVASISH